MGSSSLRGAPRAPQQPEGTDTGALGPSDSSDSGSDMVGVGEGRGGDIGVAVDVAMSDDMPHPLMPNGAMDGSTTDAEGTGERRSAASDAGLDDAPDISPDRIFTPGVADTEFRRRGDAALSDAEAEDPLSDEDPEEEAP